MATIDHLHLENYKGLKEASLLNLGHINVLCGPNGGGKTTVLESIIHKDHRHPGAVFDAEKVAELEVECFAGRSWSNGIYAKYFNRAIAEAFSEKTIWFPNETSKLWDAVLTGFRKQTSPSSQLDFGNAFGKAFLRHFSEIPPPALIPAKRGLEAFTTIDSSEPIHFAGRGILNFLFRAKNKDTGSDARQKYDQVQDAFKSITGGCIFDIILRDSQNQIELRLKMPTTGWLFADDCGLGYRDIIIILYFAIAAAQSLILIEEPENHLHPEIQRKLLAYLKNQASKQFVISTHSSVFLDTQYVDKVFSCRLTDSVKVENATSRAQLLTELGYSIADNIVSDLIVLCEGPKDKLVLDEFFRKRGFSETYKIKIWPLGGDIMDQVDLSVFSESRRPIALIDGDPQSRVVRKRFLQNCEKQKIPVHQLERYAIENYFSLNAIKAAVPLPLPAALNTLDPARRVSDQLGFEVKGNSKKIAEAMNLADIAGTDFESFLNAVENQLKAQQQH